MKLTYHAEISGDPYWHAITDNGNWDGAGATPLDAVTSLVQQREDYDQKHADPHRTPNPYKETA